MEKNATLVIGIIRASHGLTGKVKVESTSGEVDHFFDLTEVTLRTKDSEKLFAVEAVEGGPGSLVLKLKGIESSEQAVLWRGAEIVVPRNKACPLNKDEWYVEDLKQCSLVCDNATLAKENYKGLVCNKDGWYTAGIITDVLEGGAGNLLEVELSESMYSAINSTDEAGIPDGKASKKKSVLVPFNKEFVGTVDVKGKTVQLLHLWVLE
ncbi:MAG: 16S rRNA processing protein RimM [Treponemataceae bacterium]|nr:16S rRNA processing protein RimM [Treponemataceae bacterium]